MYIRKLFIASLGGLLIGAQANAADVEMSGYGSFRAGKLLDDNFTHVFFNFDDEIDYKSESLFALQASTQINQDWSAAIVLKASGKDDFDLEARWAYLQYQATPQLALTFGRFAMPYFRNSDTEDIGYSHNYSRLPTAVYDKRDFAIIEGVRLTYNTFLGDADMSIKASIGSWDGDVQTEFFGAVPSAMEDVYQLSATYTWEWLTLFAGGFAGTWTSNIEPIIDTVLLNTLTSIGSSHYTVVGGYIQDGNAVPVHNLDPLYPKQDSYIFFSAGVGIEYENYLFDFEYARSGVKNSIVDIDNQYFASAGYRLDDWVISFVHQRRDNDLSGDQSRGSTDPLVTNIINNIVESFDKSFRFRANGLHLRYDASDGVAYKFEYTDIYSDSADDNVGLVTLGVDFVF